MILFQNIGGKRSVSCPECRKQHTVTDRGVKQFQQNKYIVAHLASLTKREELCNDHKRPLLLYCLNQSCLHPICQLCFMKGKTTFQDKLAMH